MSYIGKEPADSFISFAKQDFSTSATTSYTLDNAVTNENELALFINFVRQEPTTAYTASGTTLTLQSATASGDDMYCVYLGQAKQTVNAPDGSVGLSQLSATGTKDATTFLRGDNTFASAGGDNTPSFFATNSSDQTISHGTITKVAFQTERFDTDSAYDASSNYRFTVPSGEGGKYLISYNINYNNENSSKHTRGANGYIYKNGSSLIYKPLYITDNSYSETQGIGDTAILDLSADDYIEIYGYANEASGQSVKIKDTVDGTFFCGFKLI